MIFTSYYANSKIKDYNCYSISNSSVGSPFQFPLAVPPWSLVEGYKSGVISEKEYKKSYWQLLSDKKEQIIEAVNACTKPAVFLCYEKLPKFCHRHIFSEWLNENGFTVKEL